MPIATSTETRSRRPVRFRADEWLEQPNEWRLRPLSDYPSADFPFIPGESIAHRAESTIHSLPVVTPFQPCYRPRSAGLRACSPRTKQDSCPALRQDEVL